MTFELPLNTSSTARNFWNFATGRSPNDTEETHAKRVLLAFSVYQKGDVFTINDAPMFEALAGRFSKQASDSEWFNNDAFTKFAKTLKGDQEPV